MKKPAGQNWGEAVWRDLREAARSIWRQPTLLLVSVLTLALGIGPNIGVFLLFDAIVLRPLEVKDPHRLVRVFRASRTGTGSSFSYPEYVHLAEHSGRLSALIATARIFPLVEVDGRFSERARGLLASANYFSVLGLGAALGRTLLPEHDGKPGSEPVAMLGLGYWRSRFSADPRIVGRSITLNGARFTVVGVTKEDFSGFLGEVANVIVPLELEPQVNPASERLKSEHLDWVYIVGQLGPGTKASEAEAEVNVLASRPAEKDPKTARTSRILLSRDLRFPPEQRGRVFALFALLAAAGTMVLLIACANVVNLLLARAAWRQREIRIRLSLGASRGSLLRQFLTESTLLGVLGGAGGLLLSYWTARLLLLTVEDQVRVALHADLRVLGYTVALSVLTGIIAGLVPALRASCPGLTTAFGNRCLTPDQRVPRSPVRASLIGAQVAVCFVLLIAAGVLLRGLTRVQAIHPGFDAKKVLAVSLRMRLGGYNTAKAQALFADLVERLRSLPGVSSVALADCVPFSGRSRASPVGGAYVNVVHVSSNYFETMGIPLAGGRTFTAREVSAGADLFVISESLARRLWPDGSPLGRSIAERGIAGQVIGVVKDVRTFDRSEGRAGHLYRPIRTADLLDASPVLRAEVMSPSLVAAVQLVLRSLDPALLATANVLQEGIREYFGPLKASAGFSAALGGLALLLAVMGIYGVVSYTVSWRTAEIGVRMALGARPADVVGLVLRQSMTPVWVGMLAGGAGSVAIPRLLSGVLIGLDRVEPVTFFGVSLVLAAVAALASYVPARRAARADPAVTLRHE